jgi:hypothetical protein
VSAEHYNDGFPSEMSGHDCRNNFAEVGGDEYIGEAVDERRERTIVARRRSEFFGADLIGTPLYRNRANLREVGFGYGVRRGRKRLLL